MQRVNGYRRRVVGLGLLRPAALAWTTGGARARTSNCRGIVVAASVERGTPTAHIRITWAAARLGEEIVLQAPVRGDAHVFLDGKCSTFAEAFKPGHLVKRLLDINCFACYSKDYHFRRRRPGTPPGPSAAPSWG